MNVDPEKYLSDIKKARCDGSYESAEAIANALRDRLAEDTSAEACVARSKMLYELHMGAYQQAMALLQHSLGLAEQSATEALRARDVVGELYARMNISGLLLPALGRYQEGKRMSREVSRKAEELAAAATDEQARDRALNVAANAYYHRIRMVMECNDDPNDLRRWRELTKT